MTKSKGMRSTKRGGADILAILQKGISLHNSGALQAAEAVYRDALRLAPHHPDALHLLALCRLQHDDPAEAERHCRRAIEANPQVAMFHNTLGEAIRRQGRLEEAERAYRQALQLSPGHLDARANLGLIAEARGDIAQAALTAIDVYRARPADHATGLRAVKLLAENAQHTLLSQIVSELLTHADGRSAEKIFPLLSHLLSSHSCRPEMLATAERWLALRPGVEAQHNMARVLSALNREHQAIPLFHALLEQRPGDPELLTGLALALQRSGQLETAQAYFNRALDRCPDDPDIRARRAVLLIECGRHEEALAEFRELAAQAPDNPQAELNLASTLMLSGDYREGWEKFEARRRIAATDRWLCANQPTAAQWTGQTLEGKHLLVAAEQGAGDIIQFARFLPQIAARCAQLTIEITASLRRLLTQSFPELHFITRGDPRPADLDYWTPLMSLPHWLGIGEHVQFSAPYLRTDASRTEHWRTRLQAVGAKRTIGLCWAGSRTHAGDPWRSIDPARFAVFDDLSDIHFVCLQKERREEGVPPLRRWLDWMDEVEDFADTAALVSTLDGIVTVDTSIAHLAGSLGIPTALLLPCQLEWRWQLLRDDTPWYASVRLMRQTIHGDWLPPLQAARRWIAADSPDPSDMQAPSSPPQCATSAYVLCETRYGRMLVNRNDRYVGRSLLEYGEFSSEELTFIGQFLREGDLVIDAGANIGALTIPLAQQVGRNGSVLAFEPQRLVFQLLCANLALNGIYNVDARQIALGDTQGIVRIPDIHPDVLENFGGVEAGAGTAVVQVATIDSLQLERCALIKADVEGMESKLVAGAAATIKRLRPTLYLENDRHDRSPALLEALLALDYDLWFHAAPLFTPQNFKGKAEDVFPGIASLNVLAVPREQNRNFNLQRVQTPHDWYRVPQ